MSGVRLYLRVNQCGADDRIGPLAKLKIAVRGAEQVGTSIQRDNRDVVAQAAACGERRALDDKAKSTGLDPLSMLSVGGM